MTLAEIEDTLPNGFHDARIKSIKIDYVNRVATFDMDIWVADEEDPEIYRAAQLTLSKLLFCVIEAPDSKYPYHEEKPLWVDAGSVENAEAPSSTRLPKPLPEGAFVHWFFVNDWNAFIHVAAMAAQLSLE